MKRNKVLQVLLAVAATCFLSSCIGGSSSSQDESFWEGRVQPGTYYGNYVEDNGLCVNRYSLTLEIYDDRDIKLKEVCRSSCGDGTPKTKIFYGRICKHTETYDGVKKVWYGVDDAKQEGGSWVTSFNLSTNMEYSHADENTYQNYSMRRKECTLY